MVQTTLAMPIRPTRLVRETIADLAPGECAFVPPSALLVTASRACRIRTDTPIRRDSDRVASMQVRRIAAGYIADVTYCDHQWTPTETADCPSHAPVVHIVFGDEFLQ